MILRPCLSISRLVGLNTLLCGVILAADVLADAPAVTVDSVLTATETANGQPIHLPQGETQVQVSTFRVPPGAQLPVHKHPFPRMAYVMSGTLTVTDVETGTESTYEPGDFVVEMVDAWHFGRNVGSEPLDLLVIDLSPRGRSNTVTLDQ